MLLWFILTGISVLFVAIDVWRTPEATALRWGFIILTVFAGPLAAFFYVLGCREPLPGTHEQYVAPTWKQVLGSTMHCASGDGLGIIIGAAIASILTLPFALDFTLEYVLGFSFGWLFFQAFAMKDMAGGDYLKSLRMTFIPEFLSMNLLMAGMMIVSKFWMVEVAESTDPANPGILVHHVDGADRRLHLRLSDELVAGHTTPQAWHDDGPTGFLKQTRRT